MISQERIAEIEMHAREACRIAYRELLKAQVVIREVHEPLTEEQWLKTPAGLDGSWLDMIEGSTYMRKLCERVGEDFDKMHETCQPVEGREGYMTSSSDDEYGYFNDAWRDVEVEILAALSAVLS